MPKSQRQSVAPPGPRDTELKDFSSVIQSNLYDLFNFAHEHKIFDTMPTNDQGNLGDIALVVLPGPIYKLAAKFVDGWKSVTLS